MLRPVLSVKIHVLGALAMIRLKELRLARKLSVPQLVALSGVPRRTIQEIERRGDCRISTARILCDALGCTLDEFYTTDEAGE